MEDLALSRESTEANKEASNEEYTLVLKGGGIRGLAFAGAIFELEKYYKFNHYVGTSAGAITAIFMAANCDAQDLKATLEEERFERHLDGKGPAFPRFIFKGYLHSSERLQAWMRSKVNSKLFKDVKNPPNEVSLRTLSNKTGKHLTVIVSQNGKPVVQYSTLDPNINYLDAVRCVAKSMTFPFFFRPLLDSDEVSLFFDGGLVANFPFKEAMASTETDKIIGICLDEPVSDILKRRPLLLKTLKDVLDILLKKDELELVTKYRTSVVSVTTKPITTLTFNLGKNEKDFLYLQGRKGALEFLRAKQRLNQNSNAVTTLEDDLQSIERELEEVNGKLGPLQDLVDKRSKSRSAWAMAKFSTLIVLSLAIILSAVFLGGIYLDTQYEQFVIKSKGLLSYAQWWHMSRINLSNDEENQIKRQVERISVSLTESEELNLISLVSAVLDDRPAPITQGSKLTHDKLRDQLANLGIKEDGVNELKRTVEVMLRKEAERVLQRFAKADSVRFLKMRKLLESSALTSVKDLVNEKVIELVEKRSMVTSQSRTNLLEQKKENVGIDLLGRTTQSYTRIGLPTSIAVPRSLESDVKIDAFRAIVRVGERLVGVRLQLVRGRRSVNNQDDRFITVYNSASTTAGEPQPTFLFYKNSIGSISSAKPAEASMGQSSVYSKVEPFLVEDGIASYEWFSVSFNDKAYYGNFYLVDPGKWSPGKAELSVTLLVTPNDVADAPRVVHSASLWRLSLSLGYRLAGRKDSLSERFWFERLSKADNLKSGDVNEDVLERIEGWVFDLDRSSESLKQLGKEISKSGFSEGTLKAVWAAIFKRAKGEMVHHRDVDGKEEVMGHTFYCRDAWTPLVLVHPTPSLESDPSSLTLPSAQAVPDSGLKDPGIRFDRDRDVQAGT